MSRLAEVAQTTLCIKEKINGFSPEIALILGSGLGAIAEEVEEAIVIPYQEIPNFPVSTVAGHAGQLVLGHLRGKKVIVMQGRTHFYEGLPIHQLALPIRVMHELGVKKLVVTNASGAVNTKFKVGDLMLIEDHLNFTFTNPLIGPNDFEYGPRFLDTSQIYTPHLISSAINIAKKLQIALHKGVYAFLTGPSYETPAEVNMMRFLQADTVGMSTFPETLIARHCGMEVLGLTYISNMAAGISEHALHHDEVMETMSRIKGTVVRLISSIVEEI